MILRQHYIRHLIEQKHMICIVLYVFIKINYFYDTCNFSISFLKVVAPLNVHFLEVAFLLSFKNILRKATCC